MDHWKSEHLIALAVAIFAGAGLGLAFGFSQRPHQAFTLIAWIQSFPSDVILWTVIGAAVAGGAVFVWRSFSN